MQDKLIPDLTYSVCSAKDIETWKVSSKYILENIESKNYLLVVPDDEVNVFRCVTDKRYSIVADSVYVGDLRKELLNYCSVKYEGTPRVGWYIQQFIKLAVLKESRSQENYLIWDADTVPLKKLKFFDIDGSVHFYVGNEHHLPYFESIRKSLGLEKLANCSFISQGFPCKGEWAESFFSQLEKRSGKSWQQSIIESIDFNQLCGFSEYETLGTYLLHNFSGKMKIHPGQWSRDGMEIIGNPLNINVSPYKEIISNFDYISFEQWQKPLLKLKSQSDDFKRAFSAQYISSNKIKSAEEYLTLLFDQDKVRTLVQVGANDGVQNDPIRQFIKVPQKFNTVLVEPIPYYCNKLQQLYADRLDVEIVRCAAGKEASVLPLYYIPPEMADLMNGDGPQNNWAHGQGSFTKDIIVHWINENRFRGEVYRSKVSTFIDSITSIDTNIVVTDDLIPKERIGLLVVIDVQGFELEVLSGINWKNPPRWILVEDDLASTFDLLGFMYSKGFTWVAGDHDKVFEKA